MSPRITNEDDNLDQSDKVVQFQKTAASEKRVDDALLHALSLVLSANGEYARSVSALLEADLERDAILSEAKDLIKELVDETKVLIKSQEKLKEVLENFTDEYSTTLEDKLREVMDLQKVYLDRKFSILYKESGLQEDGTEYAPADKFLITIKRLLTNQLWAFVCGGVAYHVIKLIIARYK